jgi:GT2 family glycosyltransferase
MTSTSAALVRQVKSRLLPLSLLVSALEKLIESLPRRLMSVSLTTERDVAVLSESKGEYKAVGDAPRFELTFSPSPRAGWYYLEAALVRHNGSRETHILVVTDQDQHTIPIPTNLRGTVREVIYLPIGVTKLYWIPTAAPGFFSQSPLLVHHISVIESFFRRAYRVVFDLLRFCNRSPATRAGLTWWGAISNWQDAYQRTVTLRIERLLGNDYSTFIALNDTLKKSDIRAMRTQVPQLPRRPVISLIMPVQAPIAGFFREALDSVCGQIYPYWELLLAGNFSADTHSHAIVNEYRSKNVRVRIVSVKSDADLAAPLNRALELAQGEFVARINQHDQIPLHALFCLAREISNHPDADLIYTDDDSIDDAKIRLDPRFKPDWNPDLFFSYHYLANLCAYRVDRVRQFGGYRAGFEGAEDYDLALRYLKNTAASKIRHIPRILYHTRALSQPIAPTFSRLREEGWGEGNAHQSGKCALADYFEGGGTTVEDGPAPGLYRIKHPLPTQPPVVSIIIPTRDQVELLKKCIESIQQKTDYKNWEMLVVDNQSVESDTHTYFEQIQGDSRIKVIAYDKPFNYSAINNFAAQYAHGEILALVNNDIEVIAEAWLTEMVSHAVRPGIGAVGAKLLYPNRLVQHSGVIIGIGGVAGHVHKYLKEDDPGYCHRAVVTQNLSAVTGACLVIRKNIYQEVGGLNEADLAVAFNDIDFCLRLRDAGYKSLFTPYARLYHHESISRGHDDTTEKHALFVQEFEYMKRVWGNKLNSDPAYNPNLTLEFENFELSFC